MSITKHQRSLLIVWLLIIQGCIFTESLMGHEHFPISPGIERRGHKSRVMQYKKIRELADRKRGIIKKKEPLGLRFRHFQGEISSETAQQKDASFALHWKKWGIGQTRSEYAIKGNYEIQYQAVTNTNDLLYTFGSNWTLTLGISTIQSGKAKIQFLDHLYRSEKISGYGAIAGIGVRLSIFEFLMRKSISEYNFEELKREPSVEIEQPLRLKSDMLSLGIGLSF